MTGRIQEAVGRFDLMDKSELIETLELVDIALSLSGDAKEALLQLRNHGPIYDGDLVSKAGRDQLLNCGAAAKVMAKGQWGYQACTYKGAYLAKIVAAIKPEVKKVAA